jgi:WD40 repeat protein
MDCFVVDPKLDQEVSVADGKNDEHSPSCLEGLVRVDVVIGYAGDSMGGTGDGKHAPLLELGCITNVPVSDRGIHVPIDYTTKILTYSTTKQNATLRGMDQVVFRKDGKYIGGACWDGKVRIYRFYSGKLVDVIVHHREAATFVCFFDSMQTRVDRPEKQQHIAIGSRDGTISLWSLT